MIVKEDLMIDGLHYILKFDHYNFSFYLNRPPRARVQINYRKHPELALFRDDPIYEDLNLNLPAMHIFNVISHRMEDLIYKHDIHYWSFNATSIKKANVYEKLLQRWMNRNSIAFKYDRVDNSFYVYVENDFSKNTQLTYGG
jgi:hypothetical protein